MPAAEALARLAATADLSDAVTPTYLPGSALPPSILRLGDCKPATFAALKNQSASLPLHRCTVALNHEWPSPSQLDVWIPRELNQAADDLSKDKAHLVAERLRKAGIPYVRVSSPDRLWGLCRPAP